MTKRNRYWVLWITIVGVVVSCSKDSDAAFSKEYYAETSNLWIHYFGPSPSSAKIAVEGIERAFRREGAARYSFAGKNEALFIYSRALFLYKNLDEDLEVERVLEESKKFSFYNAPLSSMGKAELEN